MVDRRKVNTDAAALLLRKRLIAEFEPGDGFHVQQIRTGDEHSLHLVYRQHGEVVRPMWLDEAENPVTMIWCRRELKDSDFGEMNRLRVAVEGVCRFINTGGDFEQIDEAIRGLKALTRGVKAELGIDGFHLIATEINTEGNYEHVFARDDSRLAVRWVENQFVDIVTLDDLYDEMVMTREEVEIDGEYNDEPGNQPGSQPGSQPGNQPGSVGQNPGGGPGGKCLPGPEPAAGDAEDTGEGLPGKQSDGGEV